MSEDKLFRTPKVGDKLLFTKRDDSVELLTVRERGKFIREGNYPSISNYSIMEDSNGNIITNKDGGEAWFYDEFLTDENFADN